MQRLRDGRTPSFLKPFAWLAGGLAAVSAAAVGAVLALFVAVTVLVLALMSTMLLTLTGAAVRARRTVRARADDGVIEARNVGGHSWVAYGWDGQQR